jgi:hypothetical protein
VSALKALAGRVLRLLPDRLAGRLLPGEYRFDVDEIPPPSLVPDTAVRLYLAPANFAGQAFRWARAVEQHLPDVGAVNVMEVTATGFRHEADVAVPRGVHAASRTWQVAERAVLPRFTHLIVEAERRPFGNVLVESVEQQVAWAQRHGLAVAMLSHGSDLRDPVAHREREADSPFAGALDAAQTAHYERLTRANRALLERLDLPVFVSTPDLLLDYPTATWLPVVVDAAPWSGGLPPLERARPVVVHAPSRAAMKGTALIEPTLRALDAEGVIEYRRVEGVPHGEMPGVYRDADIVLDQFSLGIYGVAVVEALAAGRVVVSHVAEHSRSVVQAATGLELPVLQARAAELEQLLRDLATDRDGARAQAITTAARGPAFVAAVHDGRRSAEVLRPFLLG